MSSECVIHGASGVTGCCPWCQLEVYAETHALLKAEYDKLLDYAVCLFVKAYSSQQYSPRQAKECVLEDLKDWTLTTVGEGRDV